MLSVVVAFTIGYLVANIFKNFLERSRVEKIQNLTEIVLLNASQLERQAKELGADNNELQVKLNNMLNNLPLDENIAIWFSDKNAAMVIVPINASSSSFITQRDDKGDLVIQKAIQKLQNQKEYLFRYTTLPGSEGGSYKAEDKISYVKSLPESDLVIGCESNTEDIKQELRDFIFKFAIYMIVFIGVQIFILYYRFNQQEPLNNCETTATLLLKNLATEINTTFTNLKKESQINSDLPDFLLLKQNLTEAFQGLKLLAVNLELKNSVNDLTGANIKLNINPILNYLRDSLQIINNFSDHHPTSATLKELEVLLGKIRTALADR